MEPLLTFESIIGIEGVRCLICMKKPNIRSRDIPSLSLAILSRYFYLNQGGPGVDGGVDTPKDVPLVYG